MFDKIDPNPDFPKMEHKRLAHWYDTGIVDKYLHKNAESDKRFSFIDGPITANNPMGVHHAWGRSYKDLWQRFYNLQGYCQRFQNGFDCQGLWVEVEVEKELGLRSKKDIENLIPGDKKASIAKFVQMCKDRVLKFAAIQTEQTKRLGNFMDWEHSYFTMSSENNYMIWHFLKQCFENGWIYKGHDSVPWCPRCETAISQHEMLTEDYKEVVHESVYLKLPLLNRDGEYLLVWTTTPWTIPANIAVAVEAKMKYVLIQHDNGEKYWLAQGALERVLGKEHGKILTTEKGQKLVGLVYQGPYDRIPAVVKVMKESPDNFHTVIATDEMILPITDTEGTGLVHTAVSAGVEDFKLGKKYKLPMIEVIADNADYLSEMGELAGKNAKKHPELIIDFLEEHQEGKFFFKKERYKHRYPACWRCKTELVWKVADEWYIAMDRPTPKALDDKSTEKTFRELMIDVTKKINWMPEFGLDRELDWLNHMQDWLISKKNRYWGLALPIYECHKCGHFEVLGSEQELKIRAVEGLDQFTDQSPHKPYIDEVKIKCSKCNSIVSRIEDVGNPWLDAGIVPFSTITQNNQGEPLYLRDKNEWETWFPADFITESFPGQFKNWFYSLIAMSAALEQREPFKTVLGFGTLLGEDGRPMHKSWGNSIEFNEGADKIGVDVIRWMYARQNPAENMLFGYKKATEVRRQFYLILWNSYRFFVEYATLDNVKAIDQKGQSKNILDAWIRHRLYWLIQFSEENLKKYNASVVAMESERFVSDLSTWFIRRSRDRVWLGSTDEEDRQAFYETLHFVLANLMVILSPFMPFVTDEIYTNLTKEESVHLASWPKVRTEVDESLILDMQLVRQIVEVGHRVRREGGLKVRQILLSAKITLPVQSEFVKKEAVDQYKKLLMEELNVKEATFDTAKNTSINVAFDTTMTEDIKQEGEVRELIRKIQEERKTMGLKPDTKISLTIPEYPGKFHDYILNKTNAAELKKGANFQVTLL